MTDDEMNASATPPAVTDSARSGVLVLGLGNILLEDDGLGVRAVEALAREYELPDGVRVLDGGTLGLALLGELAGATTVLLVDAVATGDAPGTLVRLDGADVEPAVRERLSPHQVGVADLLDALRLIDRMPSSVALLGLAPESFELSIELSPRVREGLPALVEAVRVELAGLGWPLFARTGDRGAASFTVGAGCETVREQTKLDQRIGAG